MIHLSQLNKLKYSRVIAFGLALLTASLLPGIANASACSLPTTDYGTVNSTITVPTATTYRVWSRMMVPDATNTTYALEIDGQNCFIVGGGLTASSWTWVDYQNGNTADKIQLSLAKGDHTLKMIGLKPNVQLDKIIMVSDTSCVPTGFGDNCNTPADTTAPTVTLNTPAEGVTVTGTVPISATASDNVGVAKVEFYLNSTLLNTTVSAPYSFNWNSASVGNGTYTITAKAYDSAGNFATDVRTISSQNGDTQAPTMPANLTATATAYNKVNLNWQASTDNVGVTGYTITRNGTPIAQLGNVTSYQDSVVANTKYTYQVVARDAAGNQSAASATASVTTPNVPDSQAPSTPVGLNGTAVSASQINLSWQSSTDNIGVTGYNVYRAVGSGSLQKLATTATTTFGDTNLASNTTYTYAVRARDAAGNLSATSAKIKVTTKANTVTSSTISGSVKRDNGNPVTNARVVVQVNGTKRIYTTDSGGQYLINNLAAGRYDVTYRATGYYSKSYSLQTTSGSILTQNVTLQKR